MNKVIVKSIFLLIGLFIPLLVSLLFRDCYRTNNSGIHDLLFRLRYAFVGREEISPYLTVINIEDDFNDVQGYGVRLGAVVRRIWNNPVLPECNTMLVNLSYPEKLRITLKAESGIAKGNGRKFFLPVMDTNLRREEGNAPHDSFTDSSCFSPKLLAPGIPREIELKRLSQRAIDLEFPLKGTGLANLYPDKDGVVRRLPLVFYMTDAEYYYPSFALAAICHYFSVDLNSIEIRFGSEVVLPGARFRSEEKEIRIPIDDKGQMIINFPGPSDSSFTQLSAAMILELDDVHAEESYVAAPAGISLIGDTSTLGGYFSAGVYEPEYPDNLILASALNTVLTGNFLRLAGIGETILLYLPAIVFIGLFLILASVRDLKFFALGLPVTYLSILLLTFLVGLMLFMCLHELPDLFPLILGLPITLFLLVGFYLFYVEKERMGREPENEEDIEKVRNSNRAAPPDEQELRRRLRKFRILFESQVITALYLLDLGLSQKEIAFTKLGLPTIGALTSRAQKIYNKCDVHSRLEFYDKLMNATD